MLAAHDSGLLSAVKQGGAGETVSRSPSAVLHLRMIRSSGYLFPSSPACLIRKDAARPRRLRHEVRRQGVTYEIRVSGNRAVLPGIDVC